jgi:hypothetical protein
LLPGTNGTNGTNVPIVPVVPPPTTGDLRDKRDNNLNQNVQLFVPLFVPVASNDFNELGPKTSDGTICVGVL